MSVHQILPKSIHPRIKKLYIAIGADKSHSFSEREYHNQLPSEDVHASTGHPGYTWMQRHRKSTIKSNDTDKDAAAAHGIYQDGALGSAYQYPTNKHYIMADKPPDPAGQQFVVDALTHDSNGQSGFVYASQDKYAQCSPSRRLYRS